MSDPPKRRNPVLMGFLALGLMIVLFFFFSLTVLSFFGDRNRLSGSKEKIAVIDITGVIISSKDIVRQLKQYSNDSTVKGIILRINSPGGAVAPSQEIYEEVLNVRKDSKKTIVTSMSTITASGGYYIASASDKIIANPGTITGSIGVIINFSNFSQLMKKVGMEIEVIKSGSHKDIGSPGRSLTKEDKEMLQGVIDDVYDQFVAAVASGRNMTTESVQKLADGRIFSGRQAKELGLVDDVGGFGAAISYIVQLHGMQGSPTILREDKEKNLLYRLLRNVFPSIPLLNPTPFGNFTVQYLLSY